MPRESLRGHVRPHRYRSREAIPPVPPEVLQDPSPMLGPAAKLWVSQLVQPQSLTSCAVRLLPQAAKQRTGRSLLTYHVETCFRDCSATRTDGTLQADVISTSCTLTSDLYPASPRAHPLPPAVQLVGGHYSTSMSVPSVVRPAAATAATVPMRTNTRDAQADAPMLVVHVPSCLAPYSTG